MKGSCACGTIGYEIDSVDMPMSHCHCHSCRKTHAAAFVTTAGVLREHFRWTKGHEHLSSYESSPGKLRLFCSLCGSHLVAERTAAPAVIVRVATLDEDPGVRAQFHIWVEHDAPWLNHEQLAMHPQWQPGR